MLEASSLKSKIISASPSPARPNLTHNTSVTVVNTPLIKKRGGENCMICHHENNVTHYWREGSII